MDTSRPAPATLLEAIRIFADTDTCQDFLARLRWPNGVTCPTCGSAEVIYLATYRRWKCRTKHPRQQFSIKVGTIFEDSPIGLDKWLPALWMIVNDKNGISSYEVARALGVTQKTAWFMGHRLRLAMQRGSVLKLRGEVEVDETFIGGSARFMHKGKRAAKIKGATGAVGKVAVMGLLERHGPDGHSRVTTKIVPNIRRATLAPHVRAHVEPGADVFTDALSSYNDLSHDYTHQVIDHAESYVRGKVHTNGLENFWSLLKRAIKGTYVSVEPFHLFRYLDEQAFRYNARRTNDATRFLRVLASIVGKRLTYKHLIGDGLPAAPATT
ncbi:MAG TPA: IS1595 family transposase [Methylomirabilota bacterium]|jgi:transposase-like protein|nr:IS1595 family transposase [Methylomirabilota bacterium]